MLLLLGEVSLSQPQKRKKHNLQQRKKLHEKIQSLEAANRFQTLQTLLRRKRGRANRAHERTRLPIPFIDGYQWADGSPYHFGDVHEDQKQQQQQQQQHFSSSTEASASDFPNGDPISEIPGREISNLQPGRG
jgi:hypothetical protein